jgi:hypothetical protein
MEMAIAVMKQSINEPRADKKAMALTEFDPPPLEKDDPPP